MKTRNVLLCAAVTSAAAGAILGVLFAPGKGSTTRKKLTRKYDNQRD